MSLPARITPFFPELKRFLQSCAAESDLISADRKISLERISAYIMERVERGEPARLTFICTHNSRRSQMAQAWAQAAARFYGVREVSAFSGGMEVTAFHPSAVEALSRAGFQVQRPTAGENPVYQVQAGKELPTVLAYSKAYLDASNPRSGFCAVMTCSQADRACPVVAQADARVLIPYADPKACDGTDQETARYDATCREICREMVWVFAGTDTT